MTRSTMLMVGTAASFTVLLGHAGTVAAQGFTEPSPPGMEPKSDRVEAPAQAFELTLGSGYTRGVGSLEGGPNQDVDDRAGNGVSFDLGLGLRLSPHWMFGVTGGYQMYESGDQLPDQVSSHGASARLDATYHLAPYARLDPWLRGGLGYRLLYESDAPRGMAEARLHGLDIASLNLGLDLRAAPEFAVAPLIGADLTTFLWNGSDVINDPRLSTFVYAGLQVRIDVGGRTARAPELALR